MTEETLQKLLTEAAKAGRFSLTDVEDGADFETITDWIEMAGLSDLEAAAEKIGADLGAGDIREINSEAARLRARAASIKGA